MPAAQTDYPNRPERIVVPSSPGGGTDILTRRLLPVLSNQLGQSVVVDNRAGAGGIIGNELVARAQPDGYTLLMGVATITILPSINKNLPYDLTKDLAPVTQAVAAPNILVVHPSLPVRSVKELIAFARQRPGELNYASAGPGTNPHLAMGLFLTMTNTMLFLGDKIHMTTQRVLLSTHSRLNYYLQTVGVFAAIGIAQFLLMLLLMSTVFQIDLALSIGQLLLLVAAYGLLNIIAAGIGLLLVSRAGE